MQSTTSARGGLACGLDFGTSNTALTLAGPRGVTPLVLDAGHRPPQTMPTLLFFSDDMLRFYGTQAVQEYIERDMAGRFVQSVKRHLPSRVFTHTFIQGQAMDLSDMVAGFLEKLRLIAQQHAGEDVTRVVLGRPAVFHDDPARDRLAQDRLERAAQMAGFDEIRFRIEPIAAARAFEASLDREVLCLVGDLGGGTSDFTVMRLGPKRIGSGDRRDDVLGSDGVSVAGNDLDAALVRLLVLPALGVDAMHKPLTKWVPVPRRLHSAMTSWHSLSFVNTRKNMEDLASWIRTTDDPAGLKRLQELLEWNHGFMLFRAVEATKLALSREQSATLRYHSGGIHIDAPVTRAQFEQAISPLVGKLEGCIDGLLERVQVQPEQISAVFLTGGSSLVPRVRQIFEERFPGRLLERDAFTSVGYGLGVEAAEVFRG